MHYRYQTYFMKQDFLNFLSRISLSKMRFILTIHISDNNGV